ncbi:ran-binding protein 3-like [Notothenia coriiceps]|uniref:Ran-binding protein 3-like n=1 Tax=Notothenia coriiceps TaxID=8208 RepID=A0A6I9NBI8_9TELE|nr:PREDICTED: ran-binding protein 3-like [Notothenia coriiceps]
MSERVLSPPKGEPPVEETKEVLAAPAPEPSSQETPPEKAGNSVSESLEESAAAYTKATAKKCVLEKVDVKTGEESESNVLQMQCKLYVFEKTAQSWIERGRGLLRLNDMASTEDGTLQSRLVMRTQGSLRLILNTKLWAQMQVDKASEKSVRVTAMDTEDQGVKVFLISVCMLNIILRWCNHFYQSRGRFESFLALHQGSPTRRWRGQLFSSSPLAVHRQCRNNPTTINAPESVRVAAAQTHMDLCSFKYWL